MSKNRLRAGFPDKISSVPQEDHPGENTVAVMVTGGKHPWRLNFSARLGGRLAHIGSVRIWASGKTRLAAVLSIPGSTQYEITGDVAAPPGTQDQLVVDIEGIEARGGPWGVQSLPGISVQGGRSYRTASGVVGAVVITGEVHGWTAYSAAGGSLTVTAAPSLSWTVDIPAGVGTSGDARGQLAPVSTWTFVGTDSFFIEYEPPAGDFDG